MQIQFGGKVFVIGCGGVAQCFLPLMLRHVQVPAKNVTIMDFVDNREVVAEVLKAGVNYVVDRITKENMAQKLAQYVGSGDIIVDLAWNIDCGEILQWCHDHNVLYINTSVEEWDPYANAADTPPTERTLYARHMKLNKRFASWKEKGATAVLDHGANPGLVSHMVKDALLSIAKKIVAEKPTDARVAELKKYIQEQNYAKLAQLTGVKVIHVSERDTQSSTIPKAENEFVNTWSVEGFYEEGIAPAEMGWGTHEKTLPLGACEHTEGPKNQICIAQMGCKTKVRSWVPCGDIVGMVIRHGEAFTISDRLTVWNNGKADYRPTVHYAYCPSNSAISSLHELEMRQFKLQDKIRILREDIICGRDELGVLLMGHDFKSWWTGSILTIAESRELLPHQNATTLQVAISVLSAMAWMIKNPTMGVCVPDDLPHDEILKNAKPYLGTYFSEAVDWDPTMNRQDLALFGKYNPNIKKLNKDDMWQFATFQIS